MDFPVTAPSGAVGEGLEARATDLLTYLQHACELGIKNKLSTRCDRNGLPLDNTIVILAPPSAYYKELDCLPAQLIVN